MSVRGKVSGYKATQAVLNAMPAVVREAHGEANRVTAFLAVVDAKATVPVDTGNLRSHIAFSFSPKTTRANVGITTGAVVIHGRVYEATRYAHMVEFGTKKMSARPFLRHAVEGQRSAHEARHKAAGKVVEQQLSAIGGRFL